MALFPKEVEVILARQLASYLAMPVFIVDPVGNLVFYNEPAEAILGYRFEETGEMPASEWSVIFHPTDGDGAVVEPERLPLMIAMRERRPAHLNFWVQGLNGVQHNIDVTAFPLIGQSDRFLGALAIFWEGGA